MAFPVSRLARPRRCRGCRAATERCLVYPVPSAFLPRRLIDTSQSRRSFAPASLLQTSKPRVGNQAVMRLPAFLALSLALGIGQVVDAGCTQWWEGTAPFCRSSCPNRPGCRGTGQFSNFGMFFLSPLSVSHARFTSRTLILHR